MVDNNASPWGRTPSTEEKSSRTPTPPPIEDEVVDALESLGTLGFRTNRMFDSLESSDIVLFVPREVFCDPFRKY